jgi:hypothetical protein
MFMMATPETPDVANIEESRYGSKLTGMYRIGLDVTPQHRKCTGFEKIKEYFKELSGDGWMFEKSFRYPYQKMVEEYGSVLWLSPDISKKLNDLHSEYNN